ncbi:hypothetical protein P175DRAFT_0533402 [Aspergillus ochraceoroseus IBT 24754]|uniref:Zn(2)-C6 fungal-type domain-containing protein n=3 Tax=Aspergillus subgen. Nidulantes TaxID=2720870 RepID=A0A0F8V1U3_9EURO|nr:uncharacterized protein P175DRAFT_0533402 [Aspergillus ochraceoroseus IBT 24754]KKK23501.1 hypothetical protein AOCH_002338 [Aspergillus ochraceoroseus]KKK25724.1 hypothetical protein ARAM_005538 [Aspergillus rambellii]PTU20397.1 hypothetical protein P175DRAFT_0533402 [Aspergillus ochraceoroseus IBT 24754]
MADVTPSAQTAGWRISKACQECRKRKIRCNGDNPCKTCQLRNTLCVYREVIRQRRKKHQDQPGSEELVPPNGSSRPEYGARQESPSSLQQQQPSHGREPPLSINNSVSATHVTSSSSKVRLYYGSTSHFALMHEIYRDLTSTPSAHPTESPQGRVEEAGAGLDMFHFRRIFFGVSADPNDSTRGSHMSDSQIMFLPYELANNFLQRFLCTIYFLVPFWSTETFQQRLEQFYSPKSTNRTDKWSNCILLMALAIGALGTEHDSWADILYERVRAACDSTFEDTHAHFQNEHGRPNSSFLHLGTAARKAISAGLHKESPHESSETSDDAYERRVTFWFLYFYENWICFHLGRPSSLSRRDVGIAPPQEPFILALIHLCKSISRSADELYGQHHDSLLAMWRIAKSIWDDLRCFDSKMQTALGFGLDKSAQPGSIGVRQTMLITLYYHTILLTFRPFLIFRGRWNHDIRVSSQATLKNGTKREIPLWLNEACGYALSAACRTIHFLGECFVVNELAKELRYHAYFLSSSCFAVIFDLLHGQNLAPTHLPWIHAAVQALSCMREREALESSMIAIQTVLRKIDPSYEWIPPSKKEVQTYGVDKSQPMGLYANDIASSRSGEFVETTANGQPYPGPYPMYDFQGNSLQQGMHTLSASGSVHSGDDLLDFTQSDMGWNFDFSTMDLESFFSLTPTLDTPLS